MKKIDNLTINNNLHLVVNDYWPISSTTSIIDIKPGCWEIYIDYAEKFDMTVIELKHITCDLDDENYENICNLNFTSNSIIITEYLEHSNCFINLKKVDFKCNFKSYEMIKIENTNKGIVFEGLNRCDIIVEVMQNKNNRQIEAIRLIF